MRIVIANPPGFGGPDYDHHLCSALAARGEDVELVTTRFRFGQMPDPEGYRRSLVFYPLSARLFGRSRLRVPLKVAEHPLGLAQLALRRPDVVHVQWLSIPEVDRVLLRSRAPLVYTAHDNAQRRTSSKKGVWDALYRRFQEEGEAFKPGYLRLLSYGGSARPEQILAEVGIDMTDRSFWQGGFDLVREQIDTLEGMKL